MKLAFFNNSLNHHQVNVADEFYRLLENDFVYVATSVQGKVGLKGGKDYTSRPYLLRVCQSAENRGKALELARTADVCIFGAESLDYAIERAKQKTCGIAFELSERWLKRGWLNILSPRLLRWWWYYQTLFRFKPFYKLNASAFSAGDHKRLLSYKGRCYKWGYFTNVNANLQVEILGTEPTSEITHTLMWCGRFLTLKHPELPVIAASKLKAKGYKFVLDYYGSGIKKEKTKKLAKRLGVDDVVRFYGELPNELIIKAMKNHSIFLFTSDRYEGWGAVANESMANGCVLVASDAIGSAPYLIQDSVNGLIFKSGSVNSLIEKIQWLFDHPDKIQNMRIHARKTMVELWSPQKAAENLLTLISDLQHDRKCSIKEGPASIAEIY